MFFPTTQQQINKQTKRREKHKLLFAVSSFSLRRLHCRLIASLKSLSHEISGNLICIEPFGPITNTMRKTRHQTNEIRRWCLFWIQRPKSYTHLFWNYFLFQESKLSELAKHIRCYWDHDLLSEEILWCELRGRWRGRSVWFLSSLLQWLSLHLLVSYNDVVQSNSRSKSHKTYDT